MLLEGIVGLLLIVLASVFVAKFVLELSQLPVQSDEEWDREMAKYRPERELPQAKDSRRRQRL